MPYLKNYNGIDLKNLAIFYTREVQPSSNYPLPIALPRLPKVQEIQNSPIDFPLTDSLIGLKQVRAISEGDPEVNHLMKSCTGKGLCAVLIDSGVADHPLLNDRVIAHFQTAEPDKDLLTKAKDDYGHGTHLAGIITGTPEHGMGIAHEAELISIRVTHGKSGYASFSAIHRALELTLALVKGEKPIPGGHTSRISVVNLAINAFDFNKADITLPKHKITSCIAQLQNLGIPVVISSGNAFENTPNVGTGYPAYSSATMNAGSSCNVKIEEQDLNNHALYSQRQGSDISDIKKWNWEDYIEHSGYFILAPSLISVSLNNKHFKEYPYSQSSGSSMAAAIVSGCLLLLQNAIENVGIVGKPSVQDMFRLIIKSATIHPNARHIIRPDNFSPREPHFNNKYYPVIDIKNAIRQVIQLSKLK